MVVINGVKYACDSCIKSHKAAQCEHNDRPLKILKPRGRPPTTCDHCKDMRKTKNVNPSGSCNCSKLEKIRQEKGITIEEDMLMSGNMDMCLCVRGEPCRCHARRKRTQKSNKKDNLSINSPTNNSTSPALSVNIGGMVVANDDILKSLGPIQNVDLTAPLDFPPNGIDTKPMESFYTQTSKSDAVDSLEFDHLMNMQMRNDNSLSFPMSANQNEVGYQFNNEGNNSMNSTMKNTITQMDQGNSHSMTLHDIDEILNNGIELGNVN
ncbi:Copper-fist DNA-binding domain profile [Nakaseomyces glabratus]